MNERVKAELLATLVIELTALKLKEVPHLAVENFSMELLRKLMLALRADE
jgi:hypothetical protein